MRFFLSLVTCLLLISTHYTHAQIDTGSFLIRVFGGTDTEAPSTPILQSALPIATTQVDISWLSSTDNFVVSGYVVFRDGVSIATTTLVTFSDTALNASTTYSYTVKAFDPSFNYSSSSNSITVTTLSLPPVIPPGDTSSSQSTAARVVLNELTVTSGISTSSFFIKTARPARFELRWGRTNSYELGYVVSDRFVDTYETTITDLEPMTTYEYEVIGYTQFGQAFILEKGTFTTKGQRDFSAPSNVARFLAVNENNSNVRLSWNTPQEAYAYVRLVRSHLGFPGHPQDGAVIYQGKGTEFLDTDVLRQFSPAYYTLFVVDAAGNVSSGAVAVVYATINDSDAGTFDTLLPGTEPLDVGEPTEDATASTSPALPPGTRLPELSQIYITQGGITTSMAERLVSVRSDESFLVSIPKAAVFENLKTIIVTVTDPTDSRMAYSFMLRINKDKTAYEGVFAPLGVDGVSRIRVDIYDFKAGIVGTYKKNITFVSTKEMVPIFPDLIIKQGLPIMAMISSGFVIVALLLLLRRLRRRVEDNG
jgi:hypothetical protein